MTTEHPPKTLSPRTGRFVLLSGLLRVKGTSAGGRALVTTPVDPRIDEAVRTVKEKKTKNTAAFVHSSSKTTACVIMAVFFVFFSLTVFATLRPAPAMAEQARIFQGAFGCEKAAGCATAPDPYPLAADPWSVAVNDETHDVYVADAANNRVEEFGPKGEFILMFGKDVNKTKSAPLSKASQEEKDVCDPQTELLVECQAGVASSEPGGFESTGVMFVAVDNSSSGPSKGDVYVGVFNEQVATANRVSKFDASGQLVSGWGEGVTPDGQLTGAGVTHPPAAVAGPFGHIQGVAVDPAGNLWVATAGVVAFEFGQEAKLETDWAKSVSALPFGIAVDAQDDVYFVEGGKVVEVDSAGVEVGRITEPGEEAHPINTYGVAVDPATNDLYVLDQPRGEEPQRVQLQRYELGCPMPFTESGCKAAETFTNKNLREEPFIDAHGLAVNPGPSKTLYVTSGPKDKNGEVQAYSVVTVPGVSTVKPLAVSVVPATQEGTAMLAGTVNPSGVPVTECYFEYGLTESYGEKVPCASLPGSGTSSVDVSSLPIAVVAGKTYHYRLVAANENDLREPALGGGLMFGPPVIDAEWNVSVTAGTAQLRADVSPQNLATRVRLEYGTTAGYGRSAPEAAVVAAAGGEQVVGFELRGLSAGTEYHYRFVVENALGEGPGVVVGPDRVFTTQGEGAFRLPDARAYELVSPRDRHGASIEPLGSDVDAGGQIQASGDGGAVTYVTNIPTESGVRGFTEFGQVLSSRTAAGWVSKDLSVPHDSSFQTGVTFDDGREYRLFSEDLSEVAVQPAGGFAPCTSALGAPQPCLSPQASEQTSFLQGTETGLFTPLVTGCLTEVQYEKNAAEGKLPTRCEPAVAEHANVPPGTVFGQHPAGAAEQQNPCPGAGVLCGPYFADATPDFAHVVVDSYARLTEEPGATEGLYEWSGGKLAFVGAGRLGAAGEQESADDRHAISEDGGRVFWTSSTTHHLFMRDMGTGESLQLDVPEAACVKGGKCENERECLIKKDCAEPVGAEFQFASSEGERVFFTDSQHLTIDSGAGINKPDLYECVIEEVAGQPQCDLSDLTPANGAESAGVQGTIPGASEDGSYVYFIANGILGDGAEHGAVPGDCEVNQEKAPSERCNLYMFHEGATKLVAVLSGMDAPDWGELYLNAPTARVSPDGQYLAFMSNRSLTGYDNVDVDEQPTPEEQEHGVSASAHVQRHDEEVYLYDAATGRTSCASCDPTGARPHGREYAIDGNEGNGISEPLVGSFKVWYGTTWLAANIPTWTPQTYDVALYQSRYLSDEGRLFFNSSDGLVPKDVNEQQDVYEYEPQGVPVPAPGEGSHGCSSAEQSGSEVYKPGRVFESEPPREGEKGVAGEEGAGCVALISSGTSGEESAFMDASAGGGEGEHGVAGSAGGGDVFFLTAAHLVGGEIENGESLYDAHECTASSPCTEEAQAPPECETAEGCRAAPEPQPSIYTAPASATFNGLGNPTPDVAPESSVSSKKAATKCRRGFVRRTVKHKSECVRAKPKTKPKKRKGHK